MNVLVRPSARVGATIVVPGDKSVSHRALLFSALAHGRTRITNLGPGGDVRSTRRVLEALGVVIADEGDAVVVHGAGWNGLRPSATPLDCGNSGTTIRVMMGVLAGCAFESTLEGDESLSRRPMERVALPLRAMGAEITTVGGRPPVRVRGGALAGMDHVLPVASAQMKTALLLAGLRATGVTRVWENERSRDHTERMFARMGADVRVDGEWVSIRASDLQALGSCEVPGDLSSAAFWLAAGLLVGGPGLSVRGALINPTRTGFLEVVAAMGGRVDYSDHHEDIEPVATLTAHASTLRGVEISGVRTLRAIDEIPILAVLATQAHGRTVIADAAELRVKESDRLAIMAKVLNAMGAQVTERPDGLVIDGPTPLRGAEIDAALDHRVAMAGAVAALIADGPTRILGADAAAVSYPRFFDLLDQAAGPGTVVVQ